MPDLIVTGVPRAGTTLTAAMIDDLDDAVCFSEPTWQDQWSRQFSDPHAYVQHLRDDFTRVRGALLRGEAVEDRRGDDGTAITEYFRAQDGSVRRGVVQYALKPITRDNLSADFLLGMKQNAHYSCVLDEIVACGAFSVLAVVRHPLTTILSWRSLDLPISEGRLPAAENLWPQIAAISRSTDDVLLRQVLIYACIVERYLRLRERITVLRHEDLVRDPALLGALYGRGWRNVPRLPSRRAPPPQKAELQMTRAYVARHCACAQELYPDLMTPDLMVPEVS